MASGYVFVGAILDDQLSEVCLLIINTLPRISAFAFKMNKGDIFDNKDSNSSVMRRTHRNGQLTYLQVCC